MKYYSSKMYWMYYKGMFYHVLLSITGTMYYYQACVTYVLVLLLVRIAMPSLNPFRTAFPFWGQITYNLSRFPPKRECGSKGHW